MSEDLIKRSDAIEAIHNYWKKCLDTLPTADIQQTDKILEHNKTLCNFINAIPSTDRPQGEWIEDARTYYETLNAKGYFVDQHTPYFTDDIACPNCLAKFSNIDNETERFDYCPHCGCRMKGTDDE